MPTNLTCIIDEKEPYSEEQAHLKALEREIDLLVYELYGLTEEEVAIVEGTGGK